MKNGYGGSGELERVRAETPLPVQQAWHDVCRRGLNQPQKDLITAWVNERVAGIPIPESVLKRAERSTRGRGEVPAHREAESAA